MTRPRWTLALAAVLVVLVWAYAFRGGLDVFSVVAAAVVSIGVALYARDTLRPRVDAPAAPEPPRRGPTRA